MELPDLHYRFFDDHDQEREYADIAELLADHETEVGIVEFGDSFASLHPEDIQTDDQAKAFVKLYGGRYERLAPL